MIFLQGKVAQEVLSWKSIMSPPTDLPLDPQNPGDRSLLTIRRPGLADMPLALYLCHAFSMRHRQGLACSALGDGVTSLQWDFDQS